MTRSIPAMLQVLAEEAIGISDAEEFRLLEFARVIELKAFDKIQGVLFRTTCTCAHEGSMHDEAGPCRKAACACKKFARDLAVEVEGLRERFARLVLGEAETVAAAVLVEREACVLACEAVSAEFDKAAEDYDEKHGDAHPQGVTERAGKARGADECAERIRARRS